MDTRDFTVDRAGIDEFVAAHLLGQVFHVTLLKNLAAIQACGEVDWRGGGGKTFGFAQNGFFKNKQCVSVFDLRDSDHDKFHDFLWRCHPLQPIMRGRTEAEAVAIFFVAESAHDTLLPWNLWKSEEAYSQMVVPYVEAGMPGPLSLSLIREIEVVRPAGVL